MHTDSTTSPLPRPERSVSRRSRRAAAGWRVAAFGLVLLVLSAAGCTSSTRWASLGGTPVAEQSVYESVVRYIHTFYDPPSWNPNPEAWCLATDRRSSTVFRERTAEGRRAWSPPPRLLAALGDLDPPVRPVEACGWGEDDEERLFDGGGPAVVLALDYPAWETPELARVVVRTRQDRRASNRFLCRLARTMDGWDVQECLER